MALLPGLREEEIRKFLADGGKILTARQMERLQLQITAVSGSGRLLRGILDQKSRFHRELMHRDKYETPYIVELPPGEHLDDMEHIGPYSVSLPRTKRVIALRYEEQSASTSTDGKPKAKRSRTTVAQLLGEKDDFVCKTCFKRFSRKFNLERHEDGCFDKPITYHCPICQRRYEKAPYFAAHIRTHEEAEKQKSTSKQKHLAIEQADMEEVRREAEASVGKLAIPYEYGGFL